MSAPGRSLPEGWLPFKTLHRGISARSCRASSALPPVKWARSRLSLYTSRRAAVRQNGRYRSKNATIRVHSPVCENSVLPENQTERYVRRKSSLAERLFAFCDHIHTQWSFSPISVVFDRPPYPTTNQPLGGAKTSEQNQGSSGRYGGRCP